MSGTSAVRDPLFLALGVLYEEQEELGWCSLGFIQERLTPAQRRGLGGILRHEAGCASRRVDYKRDRYDIFRITSAGREWYRQQQEQLAASGKAKRQKRDGHVSGG